MAAREPYETHPEMPLWFVKDHHAMSPKDTRYRWAHPMCPKVLRESTLYRWRTTLVRGSWVLFLEWRPKLEDNKERYIDPEDACLDDRGSWNHIGGPWSISKLRKSTYRAAFKHEQDRA